MKNLHLVTFTLMGIGALNWGLVGLFNFNLVSSLFGGMPFIEQLLYILVGASAVYEFAIHKTICRQCGEMMAPKK